MLADLWATKNIEKGPIMSMLHVVQGDPDGDRLNLIEAAKEKLPLESWILPKNAEIGDEIVVYISSFGFFATARIDAKPEKRDDWPTVSRYGSGLSNVRLIEPAISLHSIQRRVPDLKWANYPRSITTPAAEVADRIRAVIKERRKAGRPDLDQESLEEANIDELRKVALLRAKSSATAYERKQIYRASSAAIALYVIARSGGYCEACKYAAPFKKANKTPYLEAHHTTQLADDGPDHPSHVIAVCPNCHRRAHHSIDSENFNASLKKKAASIESKMNPK
jgi:hypothetical protein